MSKLVPERRADKNGRIVTRHVLPAKSQGKPLRIPAPKAVKMDREALISSLTDSITTQLGFALHDQNEWYEVKLNLEEYSDHTLDRLKKAWQPRTQIATAIAIMVSHGETEDFIREFAMFGGVIPDDTSGMLRSIASVRSLHHYKQLPQVDDYSRADEKTKKACRALMHLAYLFTDKRKSFEESPVKGIEHDYDSYNTVVITDPDFVQLVVDRPDDAGRIGDLAIARGTTDAKVLREVLEYEVSSLSDGVL